MSNNYFITVSQNAISIPTISGDQYVPEEAPSTLLPSAQKGFSYVVDLTFTLLEQISEIETNTVPIESLQITTPQHSGVTFSVVNANPNSYVVRVSGVLSSNLGVSTYSYIVGTDGSFTTVENVPTSDPIPENFLAVYKFQPSSVFWVLESNSYVVTTVPTANLSLSQYVYGGWNAELQSFKDLVQQGGV